MRLTHVHAKLFLLSGAFCSGAALMIAFALMLPLPKSAALAAVGTVAGVPGAATLKDLTSLSLLGGGQLAVADADPSADREIVADLDQKRIIVDDAGKVIASYPILSIGRPGTFWETPAGDYSIKTKEPRHLSSIGGTWMPWSMEFYGNFFIHGWPTYQDGTDVPKGYSGGCIRLSTPDARSLFTLVDIGTVVHVRGGTHPAADLANAYYMREAERLPPIYAKAFSVFDEDTGQVLWSRGEDEHVAPGHLVALMTALVSAETIDQYKYVNFERLVAGGNAANAKATDPSAVQIDALIYPLLFDANDMAAKGIESLRGKKAFVASMNEKSAAIGMSETNWASGANNDDSVTTPRDLATLLRYADSSKSFLMKTTLEPSHSFVTPAGITRFSWTNKNSWLSDSTFRGGLLTHEDDKSGNAIALYSLPVSEFGERNLGFIVASSPHVEDDLAALRDYASSHFFYGTESGATSANASVTDVSAAVDELLLVKSQLIN